MYKRGLQRNNKKEIQIQISLYLIKKDLGLYYPKFIQNVCIVSFLLLIELNCLKCLYCFFFIDRIKLFKVFALVFFIDRIKLFKVFVLFFFY